MSHYCPMHNISCSEWKWCWSECVQVQSITNTFLQHTTDTPKKAIRFPDTFLYLDVCKWSNTIQLQEEPGIHIIGYFGGEKGMQRQFGTLSPDRTLQVWQRVFYFFDDDINVYISRSEVGDLLLASRRLRWRSILKDCRFGFQQLHCNGTRNYYCPQSKVSQSIVFQRLRETPSYYQHGSCGRRGNHHERIILL